MGTSTKKVYEYFRLNNAVISGKYVDYVDALWTQGKVGESYFNRLVDLYMVAAAVGIVTKRRLPNDISPASDKKRTILIEQLATGLTTLNNLMTMMLITEESGNMSLEDRLYGAFRIPEDEETYRKNMNLFESYVRGGLQYLYQHLVMKPVSLADDYGDARISNLISLIKKPLELESIDSLGLFK